MPRQPRVYVKGLAHHVMQRGNNRQACFYSAEDYQFYMDCVRDACEKYECALHAYVLMTNHVHLLVTPAHNNSLSLTMQSIGRRYVQRINSVYKRTGTLWEGRYKSSLVGSDAYILACYRYIELNPVRAGMVEHPGRYQWSSYRVNSGVCEKSWLAEHSAYLNLAATKEQRILAYQSIFNKKSVSSEFLTKQTFKEILIGDDRFKKEIEEILKIKFNREKIGRPRKEKCL